VRSGQDVEPLCWVVSVRSTQPHDYQKVARVVAVMPKTFAGGASTGRHSHARGQVLYATSGLMLAQTDNGAWAVPTGHALLIPPQLPHDITMHGNVEMLTAYIAPKNWAKIVGSACRVVRVSALLDAALAAISNEPILYSLRGRGNHLAAIILDEIERAETAELALPLPTNARLRAICAALVENPSLEHAIDDWAETVATSRRTLTRLFRQETGMSFGAWRRQLRQLQSLKLNVEGAPLKVIASCVGYRSPQALQAMMKRAGRQLT
jgi:AraC-like DNA-binding protein/quercetin dioxygenase-like cupin family protein